MTREEKIKIAIDKGFTYDEVTGKIYGIRGNEVIKKVNGYITIHFTHNKKHLYLQGHQFAYYYKYRKIVSELDHKNGIKSDNRIDNLREVTHQQNQFNRNVKGCSFDSRVNIFYARITISGKTIHLGSFNTEQEARQAYLDAKQKYHII